MELSDRFVEKETRDLARRIATERTVTNAGDHCGYNQQGDSSYGGTWILPRLHRRETFPRRTRTHAAFQDIGMAAPGYWENHYGIVMVHYSANE